ncbi:MAG: CDP-alcohol phosphatidyltransferase family protein [Bacteroidetes bacterium]|nr:CDP-alcohol phosphatidyltransferase family protein [Bacteroidota bacterium]
MHKGSYYIITGITIYRLVAAPVLMILIFTGNIVLFSCLLPISFFSDFIDGYLARKFKVTSIIGTKLDSIGDDLTVLAALVGLFVLKSEFVKEEKIFFLTLLALYVFQNIAAYIRYHKMTGFHTYVAKAAAILQGVFLILIFILPKPIYILFYSAAVATAIDLVEEIILVFLLPKWEANVKGIYWVVKKNPNQKHK